MSGWSIVSSRYNSPRSETDRNQSQGHDAASPAPFPDPGVAAKAQAKAGTKGKDKNRLNRVAARGPVAAPELRGLVPVAITASRAQELAAGERGGNHDDVRWYVLYAIGSWESELDRWWAGIHVGRGTIAYGGLLVLAGNFGRLRLRRVSGLLEALSAWHASNEHSPQYYQW